MKFKERPKGLSGFLKIEDGESVKGVFRGEPFDFQQHWVSQKAHLCTGEGCEMCKAGVRKSFRFRINFLVHEEGNYVSKIFEQGGRVYDYLRALALECDLEKTVVKITREGKDKTTKYAIIPLPNAVTEEMERRFTSVKLQDLTNFGSSEGGGDDPIYGQSNTDSEIPF